MVPGLAGFDQGYVHSDAVGVFFDSIAARYFDEAKAQKVLKLHGRVYLLVGIVVCCSTIVVVV